MMQAFITDYLVLVLLFSVHIICSDGSGLEIDSWQVVYRRFFPKKLCCRNAHV